MVKEIVHVQVGQCGNQIGNSFWSQMQTEHSLDEYGKFKKSTNNIDDQKKLNKIHVYYSEPGTMRFVPRACIVDLELDITDCIKGYRSQTIFKPDNMCYGVSGAGNNWAKGYYTEGEELIDDVMDIINREVEECDNLQGFQLTHSLGGGTGSGMGTLILTKLKDNYTKTINASFSVFPSPKVCDVVVEPYNATLSIDKLLQNTNQTFVIDNEALFDIAHHVLHLKEPKYGDLNWIIMNVMSGITSSLRYKCHLNEDLFKMSDNLITFPRLHFFLLSHSPLFTSYHNDDDDIKLSIAELAKEMFSSRNFLSSVSNDYEQSKYLTPPSCIYHGKNAYIQINDSLIIDGYTRDIKTDKNVPSAIINICGQYVPNDKRLVTTSLYNLDKAIENEMNQRKHLINNEIKSALIDISAVNERMSATMIANSTSIKNVFQRISAQFATMYKRKAFLHWYKGEGMDEMEFVEADENVRALITEYQQIDDNK